MSEPSLLKLRLNEYCLGHEILLQGLRSPLVDSSSDRPPGETDLLLAAFVCAFSFETGRKLVNHPLFGLLLTLWKWRLGRRVGWVAELRRFLQYRATAFWRPEEAEPTQFRRLESPWPFRLAAFLMSTFHLSESQALNFPIARAALYYAAHGEMEGKIDLVGTQMEAMLATVAQMDAEAGQ